MRTEASKLKVGNLVLLKISEHSRTILDVTGTLRGIYVNDRDEIVLRVQFNSCPQDSEVRLNAVNVHPDPDLGE
jgi:hypothetical protein